MVSRLVTCILCFFVLQAAQAQQKDKWRDKSTINRGWKFFRYPDAQPADSLIYDVRPESAGNEDKRAADARPTEGVQLVRKISVLKPWIMPSGNDFIRDVKQRYSRPPGNPGAEFPFVKTAYDDAAWEPVDLPHDWAIAQPFLKGENAIIGGGMGRLPVHGVAWYRKHLFVSDADRNKTLYLEIDGAMSYAMVWVNGKLAGGWPYGYASWRLDLSRYLVAGKDNIIAIRLDNPVNSARWYPGAGIYRNVWLVRVNRIHVDQWGTTVSTQQVSSGKAFVNLAVKVKNNLTSIQRVTVRNNIYLADSAGVKTGKILASSEAKKLELPAGSVGQLAASLDIPDPQLWQPLPSNTHPLYIAETLITQGRDTLDVYRTRFGIRSLVFDGEKGLLVNNKRVYINGVNQHHDLGALGAAFNLKAARRQLTLLREMGCNAIRMAHNPPAPELLDLCDQMGFMVVDEVFDSWLRKKTELDFHLIFQDWHEQDLRAMIRRDRNHPSIIMWSFGNEVGEQYTGAEGARLASSLNDIVHQEDPHRPTTLAMNYAKPRMSLPAVPDVIGLNYQGEGIRDGGAYKGLPGISTPPLFNEFHTVYPGKMIFSSENASALSSRGAYLFPVYAGNSAPVKDGQGGDPLNQYVSAYELYSVAFGASADKVFESLDRHPFVAGGFAWTGWDYLGEPTPYYAARSSYSGIIDLAGFKKDRFYLYQAKWRPDHPMAHILPHWNWPQRLAMITPIHVFTSGDEAELFLNGNSLGKKKKGQYEYRLRWDSVHYQPGKIKVISYKNGKYWSADSVQTTRIAAQISASSDTKTLKADAADLAFITVTVKDEQGRVVPDAMNQLHFKVSGAGSIAAVDNGNPADLDSFVSPVRSAFNGSCLLIVRSKYKQKGPIYIEISSPQLRTASLSIQAE